jgi:ribosome-binding factor A
MALDGRARDLLRTHCGEFHDDDGVDPRDYFRPARFRKRQNHKDRQICRQAAETLTLLLSSELGDNCLTDLRVVSVVPAPDASRLMVTLYCDVKSDQFDRALVEECLSECKGRLRSAVAAAITRRKAPVLAFTVIGPAPGEGAP